MLGLSHMNETHWGCDDTCGMGLALAHEVAEFHQGCGSITKGKECIRVFFDRQTDTCLSTGDTFCRCHLGHTRILQIALRLDAQSFKSTLTDTTGHHRHISHDGLQAPFGDHLVECLYGMVIGIEDLFHIEVGSGVDGMQQRPLVIQRIILTTQFAGNRTEGLHHDLLPRLKVVSLLFTIVATRRDDLIAIDIRLRVAYQDHREHIHRLRIEVGKGRNRHLLFGSARLAHITQGRITTAHSKEQFLQTVELPIAAMRLGVIHSSHEITLGSSTDTTLDDLPGRHQV